jgi:hypothetical protein
MTVKFLETDELVIVHDTDADTTVEKDVLNGPCTLLGMSVNNNPPTDTHAYISLWDNVNPTIGTTEPDEMHRVEKKTTDKLNAGYADIPLDEPDGLAFANGCSFAVHTANDGTGAPDASVELTLRFKPPT